MTNEEILKQAIEKVSNNKSGFSDEYKDFLIGYVTQQVEHKKPVYYQIIFDPEFAKAFFGEEEIDDDIKYSCSTSNHWTGGLGGEYGANFYGQVWQFHLQQMVLEPDPIQYLAKFL